MRTVHPLLRSAMLLMTLASLSGLFRPAYATEPATNSGPNEKGRFSVLGDAVTRVPGELSSIASYPWRKTDDFLKYSLGIGALILLDKPLTRAYQKHIEQPMSGFRVPDAPGVFKNAGGGGTDGWLLLGISGTYLGGFAAGDAKTQRVGIAAAKAVTYSVLVSQLALKTVFGRKRPYSDLSNPSSDDNFTDNPLDFGNRRKPSYRSDSYASSFPSFHFTAWFAAAKVYQQAYDNYWAPYGLLTVGLASNIQGHHHWVSDMVAGALIGTLIGSAVSEGYLDQDESKPGWKADAGLSSTGGEFRLNYVF